MRMQPYIYTEARRTYDTGVAFFRPLYYDWPEEDAAYASKNEYIFGDQMLAAPVVAPADKVTRPGHGKGLAARRATGSSGPPASTSPARPRWSAASPSTRFRSI